MENESTKPQIAIPIHPRYPIFLSLITLALLVATGFLYYQNRQLSQQIATLKAIPTPSPTNAPELPGFCIPTYRVETNTQELTAKQNYSQYCTEKRSETECLSVDVYNQKLDDFSAPDGSPDCLWNKPIVSPPSVEGTFCGGITNKKCPVGYVCQQTAMYPDASGNCTKK